MSFEQLLTHLKDQRLIAFAQAWNTARGAAEVPRWRDLDIAGFVPCLPWVWAWEYDRHNDVFRGKLAGEEILSLLGRRLKGALAHEYYRGSHRTMRLDRLRRVFLERVGLVSSGPVFWFADSQAEGERIALPIATHGDAADTVVGVTLYRFPDSRPAVRGAEARHDDPRFFTLDD
jgi:hypothetical protein